MGKSVDDRGPCARLARRDEGAYYWHVTEEQRSWPGCIGRERDQLSHSRALTIGSLGLALVGRLAAARVRQCGAMLGRGARSFARYANRTANSVSPNL